MKFTRKLFNFALALVMILGPLSVTASASGTTVYGIGFVNASSLRLRSEASASASTLTMAPRNDCVVVLSKDGEWYKVNYNLQIGYMHESYLKVLTKENAELGYGEVSGSGVNLRSGPSTASSVTATASKGAKCYIIGVNEGWFKVIYNGSICYIRSDYLTLTEIPYENQASPNSPKFFRGGQSTGVAPSAAALNGSASTGSNASAVSITGAQILAEAKKYLGAPYVSGGASPSGFDCCGFTYYVLRQLGFAAYRTVASQYQQGTAVSKENLQAGDLVFFANTAGSGLSHVGIYAGNGQFIHAPNSRSTVSYSDLTSGYWAEHYYGARRIG